MAQVDLLLTRDRDLILCEVKSTRGPGSEAPVSVAQRERLRRAGHWILSRWGGRDTSLRFDLVTVEFSPRWPGLPRIRHHPGAWDDDG